LLVLVLAVVGVICNYGPHHIGPTGFEEASSKIGEIITDAKAYAQEHPDSLAPYHFRWPPATGGEIVDLSPTQYFTYAITSGGGADATTTPLVITATRIGKRHPSSITVTAPNIYSHSQVTKRSRM
jgi:hypothetical protein